MPIQRITFIEEAIELLASPDPFWSWLLDHPELQSSQGLLNLIDSFLTSTGAKVSILYPTETFPILVMPSKHQEEEGQFLFIHWIANLMFIAKQEPLRKGQAYLTGNEILAILSTSFPTTFYLDKTIEIRHWQKKPLYIPQKRQRFK